MSQMLLHSERSRENSFQILNRASANDINTSPMNILTSAQFAVQPTASRDSESNHHHMND